MINAYWNFGLICQDLHTGTNSGMDFTASWKVCKNFSLLAGYSHFFSGDTAKATGASDDADFAYIQAAIDF